MSKKKESLENKSMILKLKELGFKIKGNGPFWEYELPLGRNTDLLFDTDDNELGIKILTYVPIRKIESPEDLEMLFNAICPEKYRLPFD